jgi:putative transposase
MSYTSLHYHVIFSITDRKALLNQSEMSRLCEYLGGIVRNIDGTLHLAGGPADHIHLALTLDPIIALADFVRTLKSNSSRWLHQTYPQLRTFAWQDGYMAFSVSHSGLSSVVDYIRNQGEHHKKLSYREELEQFLVKHGITYNQQYIEGD